MRTPQILNYPLTLGLVVAVFSPAALGQGDEFEEVSFETLLDELRLEVDFANWPGKASLLRPGFFLDPAEHSELDNAVLLGSEVFVESATHLAMKEWRFQHSGQELRIGVGVAYGSAGDVHEVLLGPLLSRHSGHLLVKRGDLEGFTLGDLNLVDSFADLQNGPPGDLALCMFARNNVGVILLLSNVPQGGTPAIDLASLGTSIDNAIQSVPVVNDPSLASHAPTITLGALDPPYIVREESVAPGAPDFCEFTPTARFDMQLTDPFGSTITCHGRSESAEVECAPPHLFISPLGGASSAVTAQLIAVSDRLIATELVQTVWLLHGLGEWAPAVAGRVQSWTPASSGFPEALLSALQAKAALFLQEWQATDTRAACEALVAALELLGSPGMPQNSNQLAQLDAELRELLICLLASTREVDAQAVRTATASELMASVASYFGDHYLADGLAWMDLMLQQMPVIAAEDDPPFDTTLLAQIQADYTAARGAFANGDDGQALSLMLELRRQIMAREGNLPAQSVFLDKLHEAIHAHARELLHIRGDDDPHQTLSEQVNARLSELSALQAQYAGAAVDPYLLAAIASLEGARETLEQTPLPVTQLTGQLQSAFSSIESAVDVGLPQSEADPQLSDLVGTTRQAVVTEYLAWLTATPPVPNPAPVLSKVLGGDDSRQLGDLSTSIQKYCQAALLQ